MGEFVSTRVAYGEALKKFGGANEKVIALDADLACCTMSGTFGTAYPDRHFNIGIAEANMVDIGAGLATTGKIVFVHSFAIFSAGRAFDQIRNSVCYPHLNVKVVGTHAGLSVGEDGATHQCIEDMALMRAIPGMTVICPCDGHETEAMVKAVIDYDGPCYLRIGRAPVETVTDTIPNYHFEIGKGIELTQGNDVTIIAIGLMVQEALKAQKILAQEGINARVIDMHTVKPLDQEMVIKAAKETGAIVTTEEHNVLGGLGGAVAECVAENCPVPVLRHGVNDQFGRSGAAAALMVRYGLTPEVIAQKAKVAISMKK
ncbi:transketolase family protein [Youxingia wuxianensis]|uniref:Transketolase family protein n=1 Tax=Youxingia wuxianensis TaxID=2763678 RepID=A0A926EQB2_9FIRM|nr:transketolase family protein [Youxingia wuxianensis]MBC8585452.1 transketolase family protein [Youxingia wuxianensis]